MSHISKIELEVKDLAVLNRACSRLGLEFVKGQKSFKWFGKEASCDHAVKIPGASYEVGVVKTGGSYELRCDYYDARIEEKIGRRGGALKQAYAVEKVKVEARRKGYFVVEKKTQSGVRLYLQAK